MIGKPAEIPHLNCCSNISLNYFQTEAVKDMEAKLEEQEQNQHYLDQLLTMLKDRDPTLLHVINSSLASKYES